MNLLAKKRKNGGKKATPTSPKLSTAIPFGWIMVRNLLRYVSLVSMLRKHGTPVGRRKDTLHPNPKNTFGPKPNINGYAWSLMYKLWIGINVGWLIFIWKTERFSMPRWSNKATP